MAKDSKKPKGGWVYVGESKRSDGTKKHYTGSTTRDVKTREKEHKSEVRKKDSKTWVGRGSSYKTIGSFWSKNPRADEKKVKESLVRISFSRFFLPRNPRPACFATLHLLDVGT